MISFYTLKSRWWFYLTCTIDYFTHPGPLFSLRVQFHLVHNPHTLFHPGLQWVFLQRKWPLKDVQGPEQEFFQPHLWKTRKKKNLFCKYLRPCKILKVSENSFPLQSVNKTCTCFFGGHMCLIGKTYRRTFGSVRASVASNPLKTLARWQRHEKEIPQYINRDSSWK